MSHLDDDELLALARGISRPQPSMLDSKRLARRVDEGVAREQESSRHRISPAIAVLAMIAAASASASAVWLWPKPVMQPANNVPVVVPVVPVVPVVSVVPVVPVAVPVALPAPAGPAPVAMTARARPKPTQPALTPTTWQTQADDLVSRNELVAAAHIYAAAVINSDDPRGAALSLRGLAARDPSSIDTLDPLVDAIDNADVLARVLRLRCELRLRHHRDAAAVDACRVFGQRFPADPATRALAFGAAGLAEELGDLRLAIDEYSRALVLDPALTSSNEALLGRARVRTRLGELDEARADLRVYLQQERRPGGTHSDEVQGLARALHVELP